MDDEKKTADKNAGSGWTRILDSIKGGKGRKIIIAAGLVGMALILASEFWPGQKTAGTAAKTTAEDFLEKTEAKLARCGGQHPGGGKMPDYGDAGKRRGICVRHPTEGQYRPAGGDGRQFQQAESTG